MQCVNCQEINEYADANQANGSYICYKCRSIQFADDAVTNNKPIKVHVNKGNYTFFYYNFGKKIDSFDMSFKSANEMTYTVFDAFVIAKVLETYPKNYNAQVKPKIFGLSKGVNLHEYSMTRKKDGVTYSGIKRIFWSSDDSQKVIEAAKQLCEKDTVLKNTLCLDDYQKLPEFVNAKYNYDRY